VFDVARALSLAWALYACLRGRAWVEAGAVVFCAYFLGLEVASGFTVRGAGPMEPMVAMILVFLGPAAMPRGPLPALPLAGAALHAPAAVDATLGALLGALSWRLTRHAAALPMRDEHLFVHARRASLSLSLAAVALGFATALRGLPALLGGDLGSGHLGWD
jgi:hypothetical protein